MGFIGLMRREKIVGWICGAVKKKRELLPKFPEI